MRLMRFISCMFMLWWGGLPSAIAESYFAQIKASKNLHEVQVEKDKVDALHLPYKLSHVDVDGDLFYRLRVGPFGNEREARKVVNFIGYDDVWIVKSNEKPTIIKLIESVVVYDDPVLPEIILGDGSPYVLFYKKIRGMGELNILGTSASLITPYFQKEIDGITGVTEVDGVLEVGMFTEVYRDPEGEPVGEFKQNISEFSKRYGIEARVVENRLKHFGDSFAVGFTLRNQVNLKNGDITFVSANGFDYYGEDGGVAYSGNVDYGMPLGNIHMKKIEQGMMSVESVFLTVIIMTNDSSVRSMILLKRNSGI